MTFKSPLRGIQAMRKRHASLYGGRSYVSKVLGVGPIAYWPSWESSGTVVQCLVNSAQNGTYNSDVSGWPVGTGIGDGNTAPYFDGANDWINVFSGTIQAAFDGTEGTLIQWLKVDGAAWTDGVRRESFRTWDTTDFQEVLYLAKSDTNNVWRYHYTGGAATAQNDFGSNTNEWICKAMTWSAAANAINVYGGGTLEAGPVAIPGVWSGTIDEIWIGDSTGTGSNQFQGYIAHTQLYDRALPIASIRYLSAV